MQNSKLIKILEKLNKDEIKLLEKFASSPIHNKHHDVIQLLKYLRKYLHGRPERLEKERIFKVLFPKQDYAAQKLHYVNSYTLKVVEEFLAWQEWKNDSVSQQNFLSKAYNKHSLEEQFQKSFQQSKKIQEESSLRNADYFWQNYKLQFWKLSFSRKMKRNIEFDFQEFSETLDTFFIIEKLKSSCALINHQAISTKSYDTGLLENILDFVEENSLLEVPEVAVYYHAFQALSDHNKLKDFQLLKQNLLSNGEKFLINELKDLYLSAINFCIKRWNNGDRSMMQEIFDLYKGGLKADVFLENGFLSRWSYSNIVLAGLEMQEYDWVKNFIHEYVKRLPENDRNGSFNYNLANFYYETGNYNEAMPLLLQIQDDDLYHIMGAKTMLAKIFYETEALDSLDSLILSVQAFVYRKKVLGYHKEVYLQFFSIIKKLTNFNFNDKTAVETLKSEIESTKTLPAKSWLLKQLQKLS